VIQKSPGLIIGPITKCLGIVFDFVFNCVHSVLKNNALGVSIIVITLVARMIMWPFSMRQIKNSILMQKLQPELKKIQAKYPDKKNLESQRQLNAEIQNLYRENKINPTGGCLLAFVQLPMFMALNQLLTNSYCYITQIGNVYENLVNKIMSVPNYIALIKPLAIPQVPKGMTIDLRLVSDLEKVINKFTSSDWNKFLSGLANLNSFEISNALIKKHEIESFFGINLVDQCSLKFPSVIIPVLSVITTFLSSYVMAKGTANDEASRTQQRLSLIIMPVMMGIISLTLSSGVGLYWITNSVIQFVQQLFAYKYRENKNADA